MIINSICFFVKSIAKIKKKKFTQSPTTTNYMSRFLFVITLLFFNSVTIAFSFTGKIVKISIENNHRISSAKINSNIFSHINDPFSVTTINRDVHKLMSIGQFENVKIFVQQFTNGVALIYKVEESSIVKKITIDDKKSSIKISENFFKTKVNTPFNSYKWNKDLENLELFFLKSYYYDVKITDEILISKSLNYVSIFVKIISGTQEYVEDIIITGNNVITDSEIKNILHFHPKDGWFWNKVKGIFYPSKFQDDLDKIKNLYKQKGYLDIVSTILKSRGTNPNAVILNIRIKEGPQYGVEKFLWKQDFLSTNNFKKLKSKFVIPENSAYDPFVEDRIKERIKKVFEEINLPQPEITIREFTSPKSSPNNPLLDIGITLKM